MFHAPRYAQGGVNKNFSRADLPLLSKPWCRPWQQSSLLSVCEPQFPNNQIALLTVVGLFNQAAKNDSEDGSIVQQVLNRGSLPETLLFNSPAIFQLFQIAYIAIFIIIYIRT